MSYFGLPLYPVSPPNQQAVVTIVGNTTLGVGAATYDKQFMITGAGGYTITLPSLDGVNFPSKSYSIFNSSSALCTVNCAGSDTALLLGSSFTSFSILPGERILVQNMVTSWIVALESASRTTTAPQFDSTIRNASTAWVRQFGLQYSANFGVSSNTTLTVAQVAGSICNIQGNNITVTLPATTSAVIGTRVEFVSGGGTNIIQRQGSDVISTNFSNNVNSIVLNAGDSATLVYMGTGQWYVVGGSVQIGLSGSFLPNFSNNGFQKLPSGFVMQWGYSAAVAFNTTTVVTFPITFPTQCIGVTATAFGAAGNYAAPEVFNKSTTNCTVGNPTTGSTATAYFVVAIGN
jgi:hypothetical protein